jgi:ubiquinone/menaquinone biosynthesis C-methylase UbiE
MVDEAVRNTAAANGAWASVRGEVADVGALPFAADSFDVVTAMHMLYHAADKDQAVAEIARVLKPGGTLIATTNGAESMHELNRLSQTVFGPAPGDLGSASFSLESGATILSRHFQNVEVAVQTDVLNVTEAQDIVNYLTSFPPGDGADAATLEILERELAARMADGVFPITRIAGTLVASGHKA